MGEIKGYISQVIGPVVDIHFDYGLSLIHISPEATG